MSGDHIIVTEPNGVRRSMPITYRGLSIGRGDDNDLVISYAAVSRNHAQVMLDRGRYYVADLNSANGTFMGRTRLEPNKPAPWAPGQSLRIGDVEIQLEQTETADSKSETYHGAWLSAETGKGTGTKQSRAGMWLLIALVAFGLLVILGTAAYFLLL
jgi:pSer/pThr/pTyr-binding forkhead associated (FHA) protein